MLRTLSITYYKPKFQVALSAFHVVTAVYTATFALLDLKSIDDLNIESLFTPKHFKNLLVRVPAHRFYSWRTYASMP